MRAYVAKTLTMMLAGLFCLAPLATAAEQATIVSIEGESTTYNLRDIGGKTITVEVPSASTWDVKTPETAPQNPGAAAPSAPESVAATVTSVNAENNQVSVRTQAGQDIVLAVSPASVAMVQPGTPVRLMVPQ